MELAGWTLYTNKVVQEVKEAAMAAAQAADASLAGEN